MMNAAMPEGFTVSRAIFPAEGSPNLGKSCKAAEYLLRTTNGHDIAPSAISFWNKCMISCESDNDWLRLVITDPAQYPIGGLIRHLISENIITGWHEVNAVRVAIGIYDETSGSVNL